MTADYPDEYTHSFHITFDDGSERVQTLDFSSPKIYVKALLERF